MTYSLSQLLRSKEHQNLSGRLSPSGRFSLAQIFPKKNKRLNREEKQETDPFPVRDVSDLDAVYRQFSTGGIPDMCPLPPPNKKPPRGVGSSIAPNSPKRVKRGMKGPSARSRDVVCWAANQMEFAHKQSNMSFLTLTLPELSHDDLVTVQNNWSYIVHKVVDEIRRRLKNAGVPTHVVGCTEIQPERSHRTGKNWPHLHMVFRGRRHSKANWALAPRQFRAIWRTCVLRVLGNVNYCWAASENVQPIRKSSGGYLAKYMSKGDSKSNSRMADTWHPNDWIIVSRALRSLYARLCYSGYDVANALLGIVEKWTPELGWIRPIEIETPAYGRRRIGYFGWLNGESKYISAMELFALI